MEPFSVAAPVEEAVVAAQTITTQTVTEDLDVSSDEEESPEQSKLDQRVQRALFRDGDKRSERDLNVIFEALSTMRDEFIMNLTDPVKRALCSRFTLEEFDAGERVFDYGEFGDKLYLIWSGRVSIEIPRRHESASRQQSDQVELIPLTRLDPGRAFGELALISENKTRAARVTAVKRSLLMVLTQADYECGMGIAQGSFVKDRVHFLRSADRAVLEDISEVDLRAMAGHLRLESHLGDHTILTQGTEVDRIIFVKSGFCKVIRQLHPRYKKAFDDFAEQGRPPPNPFADEEDVTSLLPKCGSPDAESVDAALGLDLGLGGRQALRKLMSKYNQGEDNGVKRENSKSLTTSTPRRGGPGTSKGGAGDAVALENAAAAVEVAGGGGGCAENMVVVDNLRAGMSFGVMEMIEGFAYQSSVVASPWAEVYVMTKYDLIRNTSKTILHKLFCDYKARLTDERLVQRLKQKRRWNNYKRDLWDEIRQRKGNNQLATIDRRTVNRRTGASDLSVDDYKRVGTGEILWDARAQTPPKPTYSHERGKQYTFHVNVFRNAGRKSPQVVVDHDARDASVTALEEKILMTIAAARFRDQFRRDGAAEVQADPETPEDMDQEEDMLARCDVDVLPALSPKAISAKHPRPAATDKKVLPPISPKESMMELEERKGGTRNTAALTQELEERAQCAAAEYLDQRKARISDLQKAGKDRANQKGPGGKAGHQVQFGKRSSTGPRASVLGRQRSSLSGASSGAVPRFSQVSRQES